MNRFTRFIVIVVSLLSIQIACASELKLRSDTSGRYVVQEGDTLWGISSYFLEDPWRWPEIWHTNTFIDNPHLIYPGDALIMTSIDGLPALKLLRRQNLVETKVNPTVRASKLPEAITTIPPNIIRPFLTQPLIVGKEELEKSGYVVIGVDDNILLGEGNEFYARGLSKPTAKVYQGYRLGEHLVHPITQEYLGTQAIYLGDAGVLRDADISKLRVTKSAQEMRPTDRLLPIDEDLAEPYFQPHTPAEDVLGYIINSPGNVSEVGPLQVVVVSLGEANGMEEGHVLRIKYRREPHRDPVTNEFIDLPEEESGLLMLFRIFNRVSYGLVLNATRAIHLNDTVVSPLK
jgi:hypothetical protein